MTSEPYSIFLDAIKIGTSELEKADAPMGVAYGKVTFVEIDSGYAFFRSYCLDNEIEIVRDLPDNRFITTGNIPQLKVVNQNGTEIKGQTTFVEGFDEDVFEITVLGIPYPFFEEEFPQHVSAYHAHFERG